MATDSGLRIEVTATGDDTALAGIQKLVADAQTIAAGMQAMSEKFREGGSTLYQ